MTFERQKYISAYNKNRYNNDSKFRLKVISSVKQSFKKRSAIWRADGLCASCGRERINKKFVNCERCRGKAMESHKRLSKNRRERGLCFKCGRERKDKEFSLCEKCRKRKQEGEIKVKQNITELKRRLK
ncbi:MAG: hypothetical protein ABH804_00030 [archaeon]